MRREKRLELYRGVEGENDRIVFISAATHCKYMYSIFSSVNILWVLFHSTFLCFSRPPSVVASLLVGSVFGIFCFIFGCFISFYLFIFSLPFA